MVTLLEYLPDEILLIICQYLSRKRIILAFLNLNYRLNCTISQFLQTLTISNDDDRQLLSIIGPFINSLTIKNTSLSENEMSLASNIQELTFVHTEPHLIPQLNYLTDLNIIYGQPTPSLMTLFSNNNNIHSVYILPINPIVIPVFSSSKYSNVKQLAITVESPKHFIRLLNMCPELTCLHLALQNCSFDEQLSIEPHSNLRIFSIRTIYEINVQFNELKQLFQCLTCNLEHLSIEIVTDDISCLDGELWENYLKEYFPKLNRLEFFILLRKSEEKKSIQFTRLSDALKTFQNTYWLSIAPQKIIGYYNRLFAGESICIHTDIIPTVQRRRYFLY